MLELLGKPILEELRKQFDYVLDEMTAKDQPKWTVSLAVRSQKFIKEIESRVRKRQHAESVQETGTWILKENYESFFDPQNFDVGR